MNNLELNIGLKNLSKRFTNPYTNQPDARQIVELLKVMLYSQPSNAPIDKGTDLKYTVNAGHYKGEEEPTLVVRGKVHERLSETYISTIVCQIARILNQECIPLRLTYPNGAKFELLQYSFKLDGLQFDEQYFLTL